MPGVLSRSNGLSLTLYPADHCFDLLFPDPVFFNGLGIADHGVGPYSRTFLHLCYAVQDIRSVVPLVKDDVSALQFVIDGNQEYLVPVPDQERRHTVAFYRERYFFSFLQDT